MNPQQYDRIRKIVSAMTGAIIAIAIIRGLWIVPAVAAVIGMVIVWILKSKVKGTLSDERDEKIAGRAARVTFSVFGIGGAIIGASLVALKNPTGLIIGYTLSYSVAAMLMLYIALSYGFGHASR